MTVTMREWQATACVAMILATSAMQVSAQQAAPAPGAQPTPGQDAAVAVRPQGPQQSTSVPQAPEPHPTQPANLRPTGHNFGDPHPFFPDPLRIYEPTNYPETRLSNSPKLADLLKEGKLYLSLSDAIALALEDNYDIAIQAINLDIADTDILRAKAGSTLRGVSTGTVTNTLGGSTSTITGGGGPGGTSSTASGAGSSGLVLSTNGGGPLPENLDPVLTGTVEFQAVTSPQSSTFLTGTNSLTQHTATYNFGLQQGFSTGTLLNFTFDNSRLTTNSKNSGYNPQLTSNFNLQATQHLLQGFGIGLNRRFIVQAKNDRAIANSAFRQQVIYTVSQVESIYWALVSAYEDVQAKQRAVDQSSKLDADNRKQLEIGTLAPLDVVNSDSAVATDQQALVSSQNNLKYQELLMKQAIARTLNDPQVLNAPLVPTDRISTERLPEEDLVTEDLVRLAYQNNPSIEQAALTMKNNLITIKAEKNGLLPTLDAFAAYGGQGLGGAQNPSSSFPATPRSYGGVLNDSFSNTNPTYTVGANLTIPLRNRTAQADQARSQMEYRQSEMRLQQLYTQTRIQVVNAQYALSNDRALVQSAQAARDYAAQSLDAEQKKYRLGASTTANVLQQARTLAANENSLISAKAAFAKDRAALYQLLAETLDIYGISLNDAAQGHVTQQPHVPGLTPPAAPAAPKPLTVNP